MEGRRNCDLKEIRMLVAKFEIKRSSIWVWLSIILPLNDRATNTVMTFFYFFTCDPKWHIDGYKNILVFYPQHPKWGRGLGVWGRGDASLCEKPNIRARILQNTDRHTPRIPKYSDVFDAAWREVHLEYPIRIRPVFPFSNRIFLNDSKYSANHTGYFLEH